MIKILKSIKVPKDVAVSPEEYSRTSVPFGANWVAFEAIDIDSWVLLVIEINDVALEEPVIAKAVGYYQDGNCVLITASGVTYNELYYAARGNPDGIIVAKTTTVGFKDSLYKKKYFIAPFDGYWKIDGYPIVLHKGTFK